MTSANSSNEADNWLYAACEARSHWDAFDAFWIGKAKSGTMTEGCARSMALTYQTIRATSKDLRSNIVDELNKPHEKELSDLYKRLTDGFGKYRTKSNRDRHSRVFISKIMWFYHPDEWTMHDTLTKKSLRQLSGEPVNDMNFQAIFNATFNKHKYSLREICKHIKDGYNYPLRVADKYLMLKQQNPDSDWKQWVINKYMDKKSQNEANKIAENLPSIL